MTRPREIRQLVKTKCPECESDLEFEPGYADSRDEPGQPDHVYCSECDWVCEDTYGYVDWVDKG